MRNLVSAAFGLIAVLPAASSMSAQTPAARPNILWLTSEDHGPHMGCYGDSYAVTPNVDRLAARGLAFRMVWSNAPVCAPARSTIISGMYPPSTGSEHMRSYVPYPAGLSMYPQMLREAGYYTTNNSKEDYNLAPPASGKGWDDSSKDAHWRNRPVGQPFFAIFNSILSHEHMIWQNGDPQHDPAKAPVPAYQPDTPEVRRDWAFYYDSVTMADAAAGERLKQLEEDGLVDDTIVFYYADHGSGMPRSKRWPGNSGEQVPLIVYIPEKFKALRPADYVPGGMSSRLVGFVDLAPTLLSLVGVPPPDWMQGSAFLGKFPGPAPQYLHGFRGRMDEREDLVRSITDGRYVYIRNYRTELPAGQYIEYQFRTPTTSLWNRMYRAGKLNETQSTFWRQPRPAEELYDLQNDPDEVNNLAASRAHEAIKARLRAAQQAHAREIRDVGFLPEGELFSREPGVSPYDMARDGDVYPFERVFALAELASLHDSGAHFVFEEGLGDSDSAVRYWAAMGLARLGEVGLPALRGAIADDSPYVRTVAAEALARRGDANDRASALDLLIKSADPARSPFFTAAAALGAIDNLGVIAAPVLPQVKHFSAEGAVLPDGRYDIIFNGLLGHLQNPPSE